MLNTSRNVLFLLLGSAMGALGCAAEVPPDDGGELGLEDVDDEEVIAEEGGAEEIGQAEQPTLAGQTVIKSAKGTCWNAYSSTVLNMSTCNYSSKQSWIIDDATGLIRSVQYWGKCAELPTLASGKITLKPCNEWVSHQWFYYLPLPDGQGTVCGYPQNPAGDQLCASYQTNSYVYVAYEPNAPDWYREDF